MMHKFLLSSLLLCFIPLAAAFASDDLTKPLDLKFTAVDGKKVDLTNLRGKVVLIDFWATWCEPCREEVPGVLAVYKKFHGQGFEVVGVSLDQDKDAMLAFAKEHDMAWPQYFDGRGWDNAISSSFGVSEIPAMLLIGKDGKVVKPDGSGDLSHQVGKLVAGA
jgi:thiol-disulfide isomerase/thioredoxin